MFRWKYPFHRIPKLEEYNQEIQEFCKENNRLPYFHKFDINNDGIDEILLIQRNPLGGFGRLFIITVNKGKYKIETLKWKSPVNALFFDYLIDKAEPRSYRTFGFNSQVINVNTTHLKTKGYLSRVVFWNGKSYQQEEISTFH